MYSAYLVAVHPVIYDYQFKMRKKKRRLDRIMEVDLRLGFYPHSLSLNICVWNTHVVVSFEQNRVIAIHFAIN